MRVRTEGLLFLLFAAAPLAAQPTASEIEKFGWVSDSVATGGQPTVPQIASLAREGFRTIVNLRSPSEYDAAAEEAAAKQQKLAYVNIPFSTADPKPEQVDAFLKLTADPRIYPAFIHCGTGNRVGALWMIRLALVDGWSLEDAEQQAKVIGLKSENLKEFARDYIRRHEARKA